MIMIRIRMMMLAPLPCNAKPLATAPIIFVSWTKPKIRKLTLGLLAVPPHPPLLWRSQSLEPCRGHRTSPSKRGALHAPHHDPSKNPRPCSTCIGHAARPRWNSPGDPSGSAPLRATWWREAAFHPYSTCTPRCAHCHWAQFEARLEAWAVIMPAVEV